MSQSIEDRLKRIEDELEIRHLAARFTDCANEADYAGFAHLWTPTAVWEIGPPRETRAVGQAAIVDLLRRLLAMQVSFMQMTHSGVVILDGDRARARFVEREHAIGRAPDGGTTYYENLAVYNDELVRGEDGRWRFARRSYVYRYLDSSPFAGEVFPAPGVAS